MLPPLYCFHISHFTAVSDCLSGLCMLTLHTLHRHFFSSMLIGVLCAGAVPFFLRAFFSLVTSSLTQHLLTSLNYLSTLHHCPLQCNIHFAAYNLLTLMIFSQMCCHPPLITSPAESLDSLLFSYDTILSSLLDKHAPVITKFSKRTSKSRPWFTSTLQGL